MAKLTPRANRAARAILQWSIRDLADQAGIAFSTVHRLEKTGKISASVEEKIKEAFAKEDVEITNGMGTGARYIGAELTDLTED